MSITTSEAITILKPIRLFQGLNDPQLEEIFRLAAFKQYGQGDKLISEGDLSNEVFVLISGKVSVEVSLPHGKGSETIAMLKPGDVLGELALVDFDRRSASALAQERVTVLCWERDAMFDLFLQDKDIGFKVMKELASIIAKRLVLTTKNLSNVVYQAIYNL